MITVNNRSICKNCFTEANVSPCPRCGFNILSYRQDPIGARSVDHATYYASNIADGSYATAWVDGVEGSAAGQSLTLHLGERRNVKRLVIYNGYLKSKYRYTINGKVIQALIDLGDGRPK